MVKQGEQGWCSGESTRLALMWPGSIPRLSVRCGLSLLLAPVLDLRGFCPGTPVFPFPQKPTFLNSNSICTQWTKSHLVDVPLLIPFIYYLFIILNTKSSPH